MTEQLKPCPFCRGEAAFNTVQYSAKHVKEQGWAKDTFHGVNCIECGVNNRGLVGWDTPEEAAAAWNRRATQPAPEGMVLVKRSAIEYANHMADCAEEFKAAVNAADEAYNSGLDAETEEEETAADIRHTNAVLDMSEARHSLNIAIYEYRKRVPVPSAGGKNGGEGE